MVILGLWDGHDSGACIVEKGKVITAVNEERFTNRKLEPLFPRNSILYCLKSLNLKPSDIGNIAFSTSDFSLTLTRLFPKLKDNYWYIRRKIVKESHPNLNRNILNKAGEFYSNKLFKSLSKRAIQKELKKLGFSYYKLHLVDHHMAHAASAYYTSGFKETICITLDGLGDGLSSTVNICKDGKINRISASQTKDSLGLFFQEVTSILGMRILEDECKVMALSDYSNKIKENPMLDLFKVDGIRLISKMHPNKRYNLLRRIRNRTSKENFCYMAQKTIEAVSKQLFKNALNETSIDKVVWSGGVASNVKMNMVIKALPELKDWFVFPQMGDGGLAVGAALYISNLLYETKTYSLKDVYLGPKFGRTETEESLKKFKKNFNWEYHKNAEKIAADEISKSNIVFWFQDRMEYGPRALGNRSILCRADKLYLRDQLNLLIKERDSYQPFCPSLLEEDADKLFYSVKKYDKFMTMAFKAKENRIKELNAVISVDNSSRPQMVGDENPVFRSLIKRVKKKTGIPAVLNTSFNIHGYPIVRSPEDALSTLLKIKGGYLIINDFLVTKK